MSVHDSPPPSDSSQNSSTPALELETFTFRGDPAQIGHQYGDALRPQIRRFIEMRLASAERYFKDWARGSVDELLSVGAECWRTSQAFHPEATQEQQALAAAVGVSPERLYAATNMTDIRDVVLLPDVPPPEQDEGCTSVLIPPRADQEGLYGQTWDLNPPDLEYIVALHRVPESGFETWSVTCTGCMTLVGMNERSVSVGTTNLKTWRSRIGVGYLSVLYKALHQATWEAASEVCQNAPVAGAHSYWVGSASGGVEWERSPEGSFRRDTMQGAIGRSNHCLFSDHQAREWVKPTESSASRFTRVTELIHDPQNQSVEGLKRVFSDRSQGVFSINRYPEDEQGTTTNSVVITAPARREIYACRGPADRGTWSTLTFERSTR